MQQKFEALPGNHPEEQRNERNLRAMLTKIHPSALPIESFACRGPSCRVVFNFGDIAEAQATLNVLPYDDAWNASGLGFNALAEDPNDPSCTRFTVYFTNNGVKS